MTLVVPGSGGQLGTRGVEALHAQAAHEVVALSRDPRSASGIPTLALGPASASFLYDRARGFRPVPMPPQLLAFQKGAIRPGGLEGAQARLWLESSARAIASVAEEAGKTRARIGICMPGLKTADGRGIAVMRRGPRIPDYLDRLEALLAEGGLTLERPIARVSTSLRWEPAPCRSRAWVGTAINSPFRTTAAASITTRSARRPFAKAY